MNFDELKKSVQDQYRNKEIVGDYGQPLTVKNWKETNSLIREQLKMNGVKCRTAFYNPNNHKICIKQSFRTVKIGGLPQIKNTYDDVLYSICDGNEKHLRGCYFDDEYIEIDFNLL